MAADINELCLIDVLRLKAQYGERGLLEAAMLLNDSAFTKGLMKVLDGLKSAPKRSNPPVAKPQDQNIDVLSQSFAQSVEWVPAQYTSSGTGIDLVIIQDLEVSKNGDFRWSTGAPFRASTEENPRVRGRGSDGRSYVLSKVVLCTFSGAPPLATSRCVAKDDNLRNRNLSNLEWNNK